MELNSCESLRHDIRLGELYNSRLDPFILLTLQPGHSLISPKLTLSAGSRISITLHAATQARRLLAFTAVGLPSSNESHPMDHDSVSSGHANQGKSDTVVHRRPSLTPSLFRLTCPVALMVSLGYLKRSELELKGEFYGGTTAF